MVSESLKALTAALGAAAVTAWSASIQDTDKFVFFYIACALFILCIAFGFLVERRKRAEAPPTGCGGRIRSSLWWMIPLMALTLAIPVFLVKMRIESPPTCEDLLRGWDLPPDLCDRQEKLTSLKVGGPVDRVDWLHDGIHELDLRDSWVSSLDALPEELESLEVAYASRLTRLRNLPPNLTRLDARFTGICNFSRLRSKLQVLNLEGTTLAEGETFPSSLTTLTILATEYNRVGKIPKNLHTLKMIGVGAVLPPDIKVFERESQRLQWPPSVLTTLKREGVGAALPFKIPESVTQLTLTDGALGPGRDLPPDLLPHELESLTLEGLNLRDSSLLPDSVQALYLKRVAVANLDDLPPGLTGLGLEGVTVLGLEKIPEGVSTLVLDEDSFARLGEIPDSVTKLTLPWPGDRPLGDLTPGLTDLDLSFSTLRRLEPLPDTVKRLDLTKSSVANLGDQSRSSLESLTFRFCRDPELGDLPPTLTELDLHGCEIDALPDLREGLSRLDIGGTRISSLRGVPDSVVELDISYTGIRHLADLPSHLTSLTLHRGQVESLEGLPDTVTDLRFVEEATERSAGDD
jgi:Leucine-rich repeat (LRR) protein